MKRWEILKGGRDREGGEQWTTGSRGEKKEKERKREERRGEGYGERRGEGYGERRSESKRQLVHSLEGRIKIRGQGRGVSHQPVCFLLPHKGFSFLPHPLLLPFADQPILNIQTNVFGVTQ